MSERTDEQLMVAYLSGESAAFSEIFERYHPLVGRVSRSRIRNAADAADIEQQTFLQLHRARYDFRPEAKLRPYLLTICVNLCKEHYRRQTRRHEVAETTEAAVDPTQDSQRHQQDSIRAVRAALDALPESQREVVTLHWLAELPFNEIAQTLGLSVSAVKVRAHRGYITLRRLLHKDT